MDKSAEPSFYSITNPEDPLFRDIYDKFIVPMFPDEDDRDSFECMQEFMSKNPRENNIWYYALALNLDDKLAATTIGGLVKTKDSCFIKSEYTAIDPDTKRQGSFIKIVDYRKDLMNEDAISNGYEAVDFIINQVVNPGKMTEEQKANYTVSPECIVKIWKRYGFRKIDFPFVQLPLEPGKEAMTHSDLYLKPLTPRFRHAEHLTLEQTKNIIDASNYFRSPDLPLESFDEYNKMMEHLKQNPVTRVIK